MAGLRLGSARLAAAVRALTAAMLVAALPAADGFAQTKRERPAEERPEEFPDAPNREETFYFCTACHGFKIVAAQGMPRTRWNDTLDFMVRRHNMPDVQGADRERILDYLTSAFPERTERRGWKNPFAPE
jgi:hypothetical protein